MKKTALMIAGIASLVLAGQVYAQVPVATAAHKILKNDVGEWDVKMKLYPQGPDGPVIEGDCSESNRLMPGGLWLISDFKGSFGGVDFEGHGNFGYDPKKKKYVGTWIDNMTPSLSTLEGTYDEKTKSLTMRSEGVDAETGKKMEMKNVTKYIDENSRTFTMNSRPAGSDGEFVKMMELHYTRKK